MLVRKNETELFGVRVRTTDLKMNVSVPFKNVIAEFDDVFVEELPSCLPPKRDLESKVNLKSDEPPPGRPVIRLSQEEIKELKKQLQSLL